MQVLNRYARRLRPTTTAWLRQQRRDFRVAIVGAGPSGFYTAKYLLKSIPSAEIDMFETLPVPYGLARYGIAPDHPETKACTIDFENVITEHSKMRYFGNVEVGKDMSLDLLRQLYDGVILSYGAPGDKSLGVVGEDLDGVYSARDFVMWYNGHPAADFPKVEDHVASAKTAVIIGHGNVALDVARMLAKDINVLAETDLTARAVETFKKGRPKKIDIVGRRGYAQVAFTNKEIRELSGDDSFITIGDPTEFETAMNDASKAELEKDRAKKRGLKLMEEFKG